MQFCEILSYCDFNDKDKGALASYITVLYLKHGAAIFLFAELCPFCNAELCYIWKCGYSTSVSNVQLTFLTDKSSRYDKSGACVVEFEIVKNFWEEMIFNLVKILMFWCYKYRCLK